MSRDVVIHWAENNGFMSTGGSWMYLFAHCDTPYYYKDLESCYEYCHQ